MEEVGHDQPGHRRLFAARFGHRSAPGEHAEADAEQHEAKAELDRNRRVPIPELDPEGAHDRRQNDDEEGVHGLQRADRNLHESPEVAVHVVPREQVEGGAGLFEARPEQGRADEQHGAGADPSPLRGVVADEADHVGEVDSRQHDDDEAGRVGETDQRDRRDLAGSEPPQDARQHNDADGTRDQTALGVRELNRVGSRPARIAGAF